jgi:DNA-binding GntR family transcriptional regulator
MTASGADFGRVSTSEALVSALTEKILTSDLSGGTRLTEVDIARQYGVSRQSIRAAFSELSRLGLIEQRANRGAWVRELGSADIEDLFWLRCVLESEAVAHVAVEPATWQRLEDCVVQLEQLPSTAKWNDVIAADWRFHREAVACVGSIRLQRAHEQLEGETSLSFMRCTPDDDVPTVARIHRELLSVIRTGDSAAAVAELRRHLELSKRSALDARHGRAKVQSAYY